jgi:tRNA A37 N6-isopentenylltransferase MiaA
MFKRLIAITGPTASGKSEFAYRLASRIGGEIIMCDTLQV